MGLKAAIQALKHAEQLKEKIHVTQDLLGNSEAWTWQQQLQDTYQQVLILDLEYALDQKVEQELWNIGFKHFITLLQLITKDRNNPQRNEAKTMLTWFLDAASGFYLGLMQQLCSLLQLDLPFRRKDAVYGQLWSSDLNTVARPQKRSGLYMCQHCLVHLGDLARYRAAQPRQAEAFYRHAIQLAPSSGQPYNQLALLSATRGDHLSTVFFYVRAIALRHPFSAAATNLERTLRRCAEINVNKENKTRVSGSEIVTILLKLHGLLRCHNDDIQAMDLARIVSHSLTALVATQVFSAWKLVQMLVLHMYVASETNETHRNVMVELIATSLSSYLLPVFTLSNQEALLSYCALPAIKLVLEWLLLKPEILSEPGFVERPQIWPSLCQLLNGLHTAISADPSDPEQYGEVPLPEDVDLQGFLPLHKYLSELRFEEVCEGPDSSVLRGSRLVRLGSRLADTDTGSKLILHSSGSFTAIGTLQPESADILRELEELNLASSDLNQECVPDLCATSPVLSETDGSSSLGTGGKSTPDSSASSANQQCQSSIGDLRVLLDTKASCEEVKPELIWPQQQDSGWPQKELKQDLCWPQKVEDGIWSQDWNTSENWAEFKDDAGPDPWKMPGRMRQNVAMQAILRSKAEQDNKTVDNKQVSFRTPSPSLSPATLASPDGSYDGWKSPLDLIIPSSSTSKQATPSPQPHFTPDPIPDLFRVPPPPLHSAIPQTLKSTFQPPPVFEEPPPNNNGLLLQDLVPSYPPPPTPVAPNWTTDQINWQDVKQPPQQLWQSHGGDRKTWEGGTWSAQVTSPFRDWSPAGLSAQLPNAGPFPPQDATISRPKENDQTYALFSPPKSWGLPAAPLEQPPVEPKWNELAPPQLQQSSLWSGPSLSPLERLLEQQRQQREGGT